MNKEEIEKAKENITKNLDDVWSLYSQEENERDERILIEYIQHLEQKESILDKVTDKLKEDISEAKEQIKYWEQQYRIAKEKKDEFYIKSYHRKVNRWQSRFETSKEILTFMEREDN